MKWTEKCNHTARMYAACVAAAMVGPFWPGTANADEPRVRIHTEPAMPGCGDTQFFQTQFHRALGMQDWGYPHGQAPDIDLWIRQEAAKYALSLEMRMTPYRGTPIHRARETFAPTECTRLVSNAASIAAATVPPPEPAPPRITKSAGIQVNSHIWPNRFTPSLYMGARVALPWMPSLTVGTTIAWALPYTYEAENGKKYHINVAGSATLSVHQNYERGRLGLQIAAGTLLLEKTSAGPSTPKPASHVMVGFDGGLYLKPWRGTPQLYLGATVSFVTLQPALRTRSLVWYNTWMAPPFDVGAKVAVEW